MSSADGGVKHLNITEPVVLSEIIHSALNINYDEFKALLQLGAIYVDNYRQTKDKWIWTNSVVRIHTKPRRYSIDYPWKSLVVYENESFLVLNKPSGLPSHPSVDNAWDDSLTQTSLALKVPLFVTHRLDTLTSGLIVYAKRKQFVKDFNTQLIERRIQKKYVALVESGSIVKGLKTHYMDPSHGTPKKLSLEPIDDWDQCQLEILAQKKISSEISWVKINLLTGKTHQIRSQMSFLNAPILGDKLYGSKIAYQKNAIALRSCEIEFSFGTQRMKFNLKEEFE